jgi:hypothetical protein
MRPWTAYEDQRLLAGIHRFGLEEWEVVSRFVGNGRTKAQCSQRWSRGLDPKICKRTWSRDDDDRLIGLVALYGEKSWTRVASELGNRCDVQCRYRYKQLQKDPCFPERYAAALEAAPKAEARPRPRRVYRARATSAQPSVDRRFFFPHSFQPIAAPPIYQTPMLYRAAAPPPQTRPGPVIPPGNIDPARFPAQPGMQGPDKPQISGQGSAFDWQPPFGLSPSGSIFGISPMNSFKFES